MWKLTQLLTLTPNLYNYSKLVLCTLLTFSSLHGMHETPPVSIRWACAYSSSLSLCTSFISSLKPSQQIKPTAKNYKPTTRSYSNTIAKQLQRCTKPERGVQLKTDPLPNFMLATAKVLPWKYSFIYSLSCPLWFLYLFRAPPLPVVAWPHFVK